VIFTPDQTCLHDHSAVGYSKPGLSHAAHLDATGRVGHPRGRQGNAVDGLFLLEVQACSRVNWLPVCALPVPREFPALALLLLLLVTVPFV
jgi:hypothetical protein